MKLSLAMLALGAFVAAGAVVAVGVFGCCAVGSERAGRYSG